LYVENILCGIKTTNTDSTKDRDKRHSVIPLSNDLSKLTLPRRGTASHFAEKQPLIQVMRGKDHLSGPDMVLYGLSAAQSDPLKTG
jgi:hypothetical protein